MIVCLQQTLLAANTIFIGCCFDLANRDTRTAPPAWRKDLRSYIHCRNKVAVTRSTTVQSLHHLLTLNSSLLATPLSYYHWLPLQTTYLPTPPLTILSHTTLHHHTPPLIITLHPSPSLTTPHHHSPLLTITHRMFSVLSETSSIKAQRTATTVGSVSPWLREPKGRRQMSLLMAIWPAGQEG